MSRDISDILDELKINHSSVMFVVVEDGYGFNETLYEADFGSSYPEVMNLTIVTNDGEWNTTTSVGQAERAYFTSDEDMYS